MKVLIPFSGGFDSTLCTIMALENGHEVELVYSQILNNKFSNYIEELSRDLLITELSKIYDVSIPLKKVAEIKSIIVNTSYHQLPWWMATLSMAYDVNEIDAIWLGFKRNDDAISQIHEMNELWKDAYKLYNTHRSIFGNFTDICDLEFPLKNFSRHDVLYNMSDFDRRHNSNIENSCTTCENGNILFSQECDCSSCSELRWAMGIDYYKNHRQRLISLIADKHPEVIEKKIPIYEQLDMFDIDITDPNDDGVI